MPIRKMAGGHQAIFHERGEQDGCKETHSSGNEKYLQIL